VQKFSVFINDNKLVLQNSSRGVKEKLLKSRLMQTKNNKEEIHFYVSRFIYKLNNNFILIWDYVQLKKK